MKWFLRILLILVGVVLIGTLSTAVINKYVYSKTGGETKKLRYDIVDRQDEATGLSAMMRTTAFPASIIAQMMAKGDVLMRGATPQEKAIDPEKFVAELARRNIVIKESWL